MTNLAEFWVFGYGSLMWRPGFDFAESAPALVRGYHRSLCVYSFVHRGTPDCPGLVLGLDRGGSCHGMAFRIEGDRWDDTLAYLRGREQVTMVYREANLGMKLLGRVGTVKAVTYVADRNHGQYAGRLDHGAVLALVRQGEGSSGHCRDYLRNTLNHLRAMGIHDRSLEALAEEVGLQAAAPAG